jgi:hypothetical protein
MSMKNYPFLKLYPAQVFRDVRGMTLAEVGQYFFDLLDAWSSGSIESMPEWLREEAIKLDEKSVKMSQNARARWGEKQDANAMQLDSNCNANAMQLVCRKEKKRKEKKRKEKGGAGGYSDDFENAWKMYPMRNGSRVGKKPAFAQWKNAVRTEAPESILKAVERFAASDIATRENGRYVRDMSRWLRDRGWEDDLDVKIPKTETQNMPLAIGRGEW